MDKKEVLIEVKDLKKYFQVGRNQTLKAVDGVNFKIYKGETLGTHQFLFQRRKSELETHREFPVASLEVLIPVSSEHL